MPSTKTATPEATKQASTAEVSPTAAIPTTGNQSQNAQSTGVWSVDFMKLTQDRACLPLLAKRGETDTGKAANVENEAVSKLVKFGLANEHASYVSVSPPINDFVCKDTGKPYNAYETLKRWKTAVTARSGHMWYRLQDTSFRNFYDAGTNTDLDFHIKVHVAFIHAHPDLFSSGDIYTPNPEPSSGTIEGLNCFPAKGGTCLFAGTSRDTGTRQKEAIAAFNAWIVKLQAAVEQAFKDEGIQGVKVGYYGFDGFTAGVDRNPDWHGLLYPETVKALGNRIAIDVYFADGVDVDREVGYVVSALKQQFGNDVEICWSEWGPTNGESPETARKILHAIYSNGIRCFNWWNAGPGKGYGTSAWEAKEALLTSTPVKGFNLGREYPDYASPSVFDPQSGKVVDLLPSVYAPIYMDFLANPN